MRILITNDDGINAPGLRLAEEIAAGVAGPGGEVWVVAPDRERSGVGHCISYVQPTRTTELGPRRYMVDGFPADCALVGLTRILRDSPPDLVISGVNRGHNVADDVHYSGTIGGAMEGALNGVPAIALSQFYRKPPEGPADMWASARALGVATVRAVLRMPFPAGVFYNVNFPARMPGEVRGTRVCPQGLRAGATFEVMDYTAPNGRDYQFLGHMTANQTAEAGTDARLLLEGWITVTPLRPQLTASDLLDRAGAVLGDGALDGGADDERQGAGPASRRVAGG